MAQEFLQLLLFRLPRLTRQGKVSRDLPLLFVVIFTLTKGVDNQENWVERNYGIPLTFG